MILRLRKYYSYQSMEKLLGRLAFHPNPALFIKDPLTSQVGMQILSCSVTMLQEAGLEGLTFKKLASEMKSTEATIYRYFTNKQQLLMYIMSIYAASLQMRLVLATTNISNPVDRLKEAIHCLMEVPKKDSMMEGMKLTQLHAIWCSEMPRWMDGTLTDSDQRKWWYQDLIELADRIKQIISESFQSNTCTDAHAWMILEWTQRIKHLGRSNFPVQTNKMNEEQFVISLIRMIA
jgi:AcrR family transcriptional regulator